MTVHRFSLTNILEIKRERLFAVMTREESDASLARAGAQGRYLPAHRHACHQAFAREGGKSPIDRAEVTAAGAKIRLLPSACADGQAEAEAVRLLAWHGRILVAPSQAGRTPCYHRFESKNRSARNPDSGPVRQPPKQRRAATVMEGADAIIDPARSSGPRAGHGARDGVGSGAIARGRRHSGRADPHRQAAARRRGSSMAARSRRAAGRQSLSDWFLQCR
jgi:hypothetical protein